MRFSYLSSRSTVSVMEKEEEEKRQRIPCCLTTTTSRIFFKIKSCTERKGKRKRLVFLSLLSTYSRHIYIYTYIRAYISGKRSTRYTRLLGAPLLPRVRAAVRAVCTRVRCSFFIHPRAQRRMAETRAGGLSLPRSADKSLDFCISFFLSSQQKLYVYVYFSFPFFSFVSITGGGKIYTIQGFL